MSDPSTNAEPEALSPPELREHAKRQETAAAEARAEAESLREKNRSLALQVAGVDVESPVGKLFVKANPELTEVDDIKAAWAEVAPQGGAPTPPADDGPTPEELEHAAARASLNTGGTPPGDEPTPDVWPNAIAGFQADRAAGVRVERAQQNALQKVVDAAAAGDERVIFNEAEWKSQFG